MLQILYILVFTVIAFFAVSNLIRSLVTLNVESNRRVRTGSQPPTGKPRRPVSAPHPELLDDYGQPIDEPLLVVRSINVDDAREKLDALYDASPSSSPEPTEES